MSPQQSKGCAEGWGPGEAGSIPEAAGKRNSINVQVQSPSETALRHLLNERGSVEALPTLGFSDVTAEIDVPEHEDEQKMISPLLLCFVFHMALPNTRWFPLQVLAMVTKQTSPRPFTERL